MKIKELFTDYYKLGMVAVDLLLLGNMHFRPDMQWNVFTYFLLISRILFPLVVLIFDTKGIWWFYYITSIVLTLDITFDDFTAMSAIIMLMLFIPNDKVKSKIAVFISYVVSIFIVAAMHDKQPYHLFAHFLGCILLCLNVYKLGHRKDTKIKFNPKLELTNDEILILDELVKGKYQKEIEHFSQNTVTEKLKQAKIRNGIDVKNTDELLKRYKEYKY